MVSSVMSGGPGSIIIFSRDGVPCCFYYYSSMSYKPSVISSVVGSHLQSVVVK